MRPILVPLRFVSDPEVLSFFQELLAAPLIKTVDDDYQVEAADSTVLVDTALKAITATLPMAAAEVGLMLFIKNIGAAAFDVTIDSNGEDIDGTPDMTLADTESVVLQSDGTAWWIIASH